MKIILLHAGVKEIRELDKSTIDVETAFGRMYGLWGVLTDPVVTNATLLISNMTPIPSLQAAVDKFNHRYYTWKVNGVWPIQNPMASVSAADVSEDGIHLRKRGYEKMAQDWYIYYNFARDRGLIP